MFEKILIANRGEIACRVAATARRLGIKTVAIYSDADANAKHVAACDESVHVGGSAPRDSYLQWQRILDAAKATGAQAIHPGYGFLSENEAFAQACADAGLVFIGPPPSAIEAMGLKAESKRLMEQAGVPLVPGYHGADQDAALLAREAGRIGYPVLIKASAGGGGKGMRVVEKADDFAAALASCQREAINSFGDQAVLIEKYVQRPRHIEIQVFADTQGHAVYLFERDCSVQRRHQKVLEEAPAPGMTEAMRRQMGEAAVAAAKAVGYVGAGTVEFIVEQRGETPSAATGRPEQASAPSGGSEDTSVPSVGADMRFFFMEMNTRLQVEHPVTEAITGLDLVEWQLRVAAGQPLPLAQDQLKIHGHAIEARICAESPDNDFLPATGTLAVYARPQATAFTVGDVRIDDGVEQGDAISPFYDSMIAKLIVHGDTREQALARLDAALAQVRIVGLATNVQFLRRVVRPGGAFARADLDTALIQRDREALFHQQPVAREQAVAIAVAHRLQGEQPAPAAVTVWTDPWAARDGFHSHAVAQRGFTFDVGGEPVRATLHYGRTLADGSALTLAVEDGAPQPLAFAPAADGAMRVDYAGRRTVAHVHRGADAQGQVLHVFTPAGAAQLSVVDPLARAGAAHAEGGQLTAPMPGKVVSFAVKAGDKVAKGQPLAVMEAMKMEHTIAAPADGEVEELLYAPGDQVAEGAALLRLQSA
ncbi:MAG: acetyl/propionyl/methylcrotonyl-CoA carboxylase subunit alpha [Burkholderiaceae bacterium]|nr:acetyl/propionyl/methylcrotonyl-CoA carboxylase subunit alpha [Burkholderiaceae bacterium]